VVVNECGDELYNYLDVLERQHETTRWRADYINSGHDECLNYLFWHNTIPNASAVLMRRAVLERAGGPPQNMLLCGDWWTYINVLSISDIAYVSTPLNFFREHLNNVRSRVSLEQGTPELLATQRLVIQRFGLPNPLNNDNKRLHSYVNTLIGTRRRPPYQKVPPGDSLRLLWTFASMHSKVFLVGLSMLAWEQTADIVRRAGLLETAKRLKRGLAKGGH
jgi:hypothetical protein